jgi:Flp pilus assembly protein TadG
MKAQKSAPAKRETPASFLARLSADKRGNVIALTAAAIIPLAGMVGGAVDMSRMYAVKSRLQSACDAGALSGRRIMGGNTWNANGNAANAQAQTTFDLNFSAGAFGSENLTRSFSETGGNVSGTASAQVPMTLMRIFNKPTATITVTCNSEMRIPNTDVMFVLDNTGSMNDPIPADPSGQRKIDGLKDAVKCFYQVLAKRDAGAPQATCGVAPVNTGIGNAVQLRFGFMPYSTNVNVGKLLPTTFFANNWDYQSRVVNTAPEWRPTAAGTESAPVPGASSGGPTSWGSWTNNSTSIPGYANQIQPRANCIGLGVPPEEENAQGAMSAYGFVSRETVTYPDADQTTTYSATQPFKNVQYRYNWSNSSGGRCTLQRRTSATWTETTPATTQRSVTWTQLNVVDQTRPYTYKRVLGMDISGLKNGSSWNSTISRPINLSADITDMNNATYKLAATRTTTWSGCIEERQTMQNTNGNMNADLALYQYPATDPMPSPLGSVYDLNIDLTPNAGRPETLWAPHLSDFVWGRRDGSNNNTLDPVDSTNGSPSRLVSSACPVEARKMQVWNDGTLFSSYVNSMTPTGNTYHDIGLLWGWRFLSPTGIFAAENATTPGGAQIQRHLIFMTDGDTVNTMSNYTAYGAHWWDRRETNSTTDSDLEAVTDARTDAMCRELKDHANVQVWVVSYGGGLDPATTTRLRACATDASHFFEVTSTAQLVSSFSGIATRISQLRLTN